MHPLDALVALVRQALHPRRKVDAAALGSVALTDLKQTQVVYPAAATDHAQDPPALVLDDQLRFQGVAFLFAAVVAPLLFLGRSIGISVTSTTTTSSCTFD